MVTIRIPIQSPACPVENSIEGLSRSGVGIEHQKSGKRRGVALAENQVPVARQDAHVVAVLVERMLPPPLTNGANQDLLAWMHVRIAVVGLVRIFGSVIRVHDVWHRTTVYEEVSGVVGLGRDRELTSWICNHAANLCRNLC